MIEINQINNAIQRPVVGDEPPITLESLEQSYEDYNYFAPYFAFFDLFFVMLQQSGPVETMVLRTSVTARQTAPLERG